MQQSGLVFSRIQSPSSILTFQKCPRKYYFRYILGIEGPPTLPLVRGKVVHSVLEDFFNLNPSNLTRENAEFVLSMAAQEILSLKWRAESALLELCPSESSRFAVFEESLLMVQQWIHRFVLPRLLAMQGEPRDNFAFIVPDRERHFLSKQMGVQGFVDVIERVNGEVRIMDYKTSQSIDVDEHRLQLGIYAMLYEEQQGILPHKVGVYFLKNSSAEFVPVDSALVDYARREVAFTHEKTQTTVLENYPLRPGSHCKWSSGQCEYYDYCFKGKKIPEGAVFRTSHRERAVSGETVLNSSPEERKV